MRVVLCDDQQMFVESLAIVLSGRDWTVCATAFDVEAAERAVMCHRPDVAVLDFCFPVRESLDLARRLRARVPGTGLMILTASTEPAALECAVEVAAGTGAAAVASRTADIGQVIAAMERIARGDDREDQDVLVGTVVARSRCGKSQHDLIDRFLTGRERDVLAELVRGQSTGKIAANLGITVNTTRSHIQSILDKLGVHSRVEAAALAARTGHANIATDPLLSMPRTPSVDDSPTRA